MTFQITEPRALERLARRIADQVADRPELAVRAERLVERIVSQQFHIAVLGEFKRGKSTLVNALIGRPVLPSGVVPLTTVATEVHFGSSETVVIFADRRVAIEPSKIADFVTEVGNPSNERGVRRVEVGVETVFGAPGVVLVDTPGVASVNEHNTEAAHDALADADGAVVVLSADSPLSASEEELLAELGNRHVKVFVVINKCDHLSQSELEDVRTFVTPHIQRLLGGAIAPYCVAARPALEAAATGDVPGAAAAFPAFRDALHAFVRDDLVAARHASVVGELERIGAGLAESVRIEEAASALDLEKLTARVRQFEDAAREGHRLLDEDRVVMDHEVTELIAEVGAKLAGEAATAARDRQVQLASSVDAVPFRQLDGVLQDAVAASVREGFEPVRRAAEEHVEARWSTVAERFGSRVQERVDDLRAVASELFAVHLPVVAVPRVSEQRERFSYLFLRIETPNAAVGRLVRAMVPTRRARRRAIRLAQRSLAEELDKHAGRARYDMAERLQAAKHQLVEEMIAEVRRTEASILEATGRARAALQLTTREQQERRRVRTEAMVVVGEVADVATRR